MDGILILTTQFVIFAVILGSYLRRRHTLTNSHSVQSKRASQFIPRRLFPCSMVGVLRKSR